MRSMTQMPAIIRGLEEWQHYLEGMWHPIKIWTDHKNLEYFRVTQQLNQWQARWLLYLSRFDFTLHHKPGHSMSKPNMLSHRADHRSRQGNNNNFTLLSPTLFHIHVLSSVHLEGDKHNILKEVRQSLWQDAQEEPVERAAWELCKDKDWGTVKSAEWSESDGLLMFRGIL
jgi:hypothetical protein